MARFLAHGLLLLLGAARVACWAPAGAEELELESWPDDVDPGDLTAEPDSVQWYRGEGVVSLANITLDQAREKAWNQARVNALSQASVEVVGVAALKIQEGSAAQDRDQFAQFVRTVARGRIVALDTLFDSHQEIAIPGSARSELAYRVAIRARVRPETGVPDPGFQVELQVNRQVFRDGEALSFTLEATRDCYVTVFNLYGNDSLVVIFPNPQLPDNRLEPGRIVAVPPRGAGWEMPAGLLPGRDADEEMLLAVATREDVPLPALRGAGAGLVAVGDALLAINHWLVDVPLGQRTQAVAAYRIVK